MILNNLQNELDGHLDSIFISSIDHCIEKTLKNAVLTALDSDSSDTLLALTSAVNAEKESLQKTHPI